MTTATPRVFMLVLTLCAVSLLPATAQDSVRITGAFTTFTGIVGGNSTYMSYCGADSCAVPGGTPPPLICPDAGCGPLFADNAGARTNYPLGNPQFDTSSSVAFWVDGAVSNNLTFKSNGDGGLLQINPLGEFKLGTLSFTNGTWLGNAAFGFTIIVQDSSSGSFHGTHTFTGFLDLLLTPTDLTKSPEANADYVYIADANGNPVANPFTLQTLTSMRVYEAFDAPAGSSNTGAVTLYGQLGSLELTRMADPTGGAFLDFSLTPDLGGPPVQQFTYHVCPLYDQNAAKKSGSAYPIKLQLCDATGNNLSSSSITVHAVSVTRISMNTSATPDDTGNANPDADFRYDATLAGYIFNLSTTGYPTGTYTLNFTASKDPTVHSAQFAVK
jgi:hypothetical protein